MPNLDFVGRPPFYEVIRTVCRGYFRLFHFAEHYGLENVPVSGPYLITPNHVSYFDPLIVGGFLSDGIVRAMAWEALFNGGFFERFIRQMGAFPVNTEGKDIAGYREAYELLKKGERIIVFPEGERTRNGRLLAFKEGFARLALKAGGVPIVPVCIHGADMAWPRGYSAPRPWFKIKVSYLPPIYPHAIKGMARHDTATEITKQVRDAIADEYQRLNGGRAV